MGATKKKIPTLTKKQEELLPDILDTIQEMVDELQNQPPISREMSIVTTKLEEAEMWLYRALAVMERTDLLPDDDSPDVTEDDDPESDDDSEEENDSDDDSEDA